MATLSVCVFVLCTVMIVQVFSHPHVSDECLMMNSPMLVTFAFAVFVVGDIETPLTSICSELCEYSQDDYCDDGGPGSDYSNCPFGTDCKVVLSPPFQTIVVLCLI